MIIPKHSEHTRQILDRIEGWGFSSEVQRRIGAFNVIWGIFETSLESTLWALNQENVKGVRPSTDRTSVSDWIRELSRSAGNLTLADQDIAHRTSLAAADLLEYRHALIHGWLLPFTGGAIFIRNPTWNGEARRRPHSEAHVDENLMDMAIDSAWVLCTAIFAIRDACTTPSRSAQIASLTAELSRATSQSSELRHLTALMNHEKY